LPKSPTRRLYLIPVLSKALDILELMQKEEQPMALEAIFQRTRISKTTVYRILKTFVHRGYLAQSQDGLYRRRCGSASANRVRRCLFQKQ
jgi:ribose transport system substrate-binding protein